MDYEKAYKEAQERAKKLTSDMTTLQKIREFIFPELRESEDEKIRKEIVEYFKHCSGGDKVSIKFPEWIAYLEKQKEQKPAEWSEEDQLNLNWVIAILNGEPCDLDIQLESLISWLKSLRPSWKPSEEQMKALERASTNKYLSAEQYDILVSLYEDLKKLM